MTDGEQAKLWTMLGEFIFNRVSKSREALQAQTHVPA
jgi:hypothetical protein